MVEGEFAKHNMHILQLCGPFSFELVLNTVLHQNLEFMSCVACIWLFDVLYAIGQIDMLVRCIQGIIS